MGKTTPIEWCDSTLNLMMGCDGCEMAAKGGSGTCYAEVLTNRHAGHSSGYPASFYEPKLFLDRLREAERWPDLTGIERSDKPHLSGLPRHIFHGDMGDYWTESLDLMWLAPYVERIADIPGVHQFLTKRPGRMVKFWKAYGPVPANFVLMTSVTDKATAKARISKLLEIQGAILGLSVEPLVEAIDLHFTSGPSGANVPANEWGQPLGPCGYYCDEEIGHVDHRGISWVIVGGESGHGARPCDVAWIRSIVQQCQAAGVPVFVKQLGKWIFARGRERQARTGWERSIDFCPAQYRYPNGDRFAPPVIGDNANFAPPGWDAFTLGAGASEKGGNPKLWPADLQGLREMPEVRP